MPLLAFYGARSLGIIKEKRLYIVVIIEALCELMVDVINDVTRLDWESNILRAGDVWRK